LPPGHYNNGACWVNPRQGAEPPILRASVWWLKHCPQIRNRQKCRKQTGLDRFLPRRCHRSLAVPLQLVNDLRVRACPMGALWGRLVLRKTEIA